METLPRTAFEGFYFDGRTANRQPVTVTVTPSGLLINLADRSTLWWLYEQVRQTQGFQPGDPVRFERGEGIAEAVVLPGDGVLEAIRQIAPGVGGRFHAPARWAARFSRIVLTAVIAGVILMTFYFWGIPALTEAAASRVPVSWEERLGGAVVEQLAPAESRCNDPERARVLEQILATLLAPQPASPYRFTITVVDRPAANAFAAPGGQVVIFHGLLVKAESAEEFAGVLAHEIEHIRQRHSLKALFRALSLRAILAVSTGSGSGTGPVLEAAGAMGALRYQRADEEAADLGGMQMIQAAQIDPMGIVSLLHRLDENSGQSSPGLEYLSTHPLTEDRTARLGAIAEQADYIPTPLLPNYDWNDLREICAARQ